MAAFLEPGKASTTVLGDMQKHLLKRAAQDTSRRQDIIHPSELAKPYVCPRAIAWRIQGVEPDYKQKTNGHQLELIFQEGHSAHAKYQDLLADMGVLYGSWSCPVEDCEEIATQTGRPNCPEHLCPMKYEEVRLDAETELMIVGHEDGGIWDMEALVEIKTIGLGTLRMEQPELVRKHSVKVAETGKTVVDYDALWKDIKRPLLSHRKQTGIYLNIAQRMGLPFKKVIFIYEFKATQATKEFVTTYEADLIEPLIETCKDIKWAVEKDRTMPRPDWAEKEHKACMECVFRKRCWYGEDGDTESDPGTRAGKPGGEEGAGQAADPAPDAPRGRRPRTAQGSHRPVRQRTDGPVHVADEVVGVPRESTGRSRGGRKVRRSSR